MKVIDPGHRYSFHILDGELHMELQFVKRQGPKFPGNVGAYPGTTSQEVLRALIDRAKYVNNQTPCWQTRLSIKLMEICIWLYEQRAALRHGRRAPSLKAAIYGDYCKICGHVGCVGSCHEGNLGKK